MVKDMVKIIISGYGKMGHIVENELKAKGIELILATDDICSVPKETASECVCIDFTTPEAFRENYRFIAASFRAAVVGTTGWSDIESEVVECFRKCGTTMIYASNFSIGVNVLYAAVDLLSRKLGAVGGYMPYIVEKHHIHKLDAPSGTAKSIAEIVDAGMGGSVDIQSVRCGEIPGIHTVGFEGVNDRITITHEAFSRAGFAQGAVYAATLTETLSGVHKFQDLLTA